MLSDLTDALTGRSRQREREIKAALSRKTCPPPWDDVKGQGKWCQELYDRNRYPAELPEHSRSVEIQPDIGRNRFWADMAPPPPAELSAPRYGGLDGTLDRTPDPTLGEMIPHTRLMQSSAFPFPNEDNVNTNMNPFLGVGPAPFFGSRVKQGLGDASARTLEITTGARGPFRQAKRTVEKSHPRNQQNLISQGVDLGAARERDTDALSKWMPYQLPFQQTRDTGVRTMPFGAAPLQPELRVLPYDRLGITQHLNPGFQNIPSAAQANPNSLYQTETNWQPLTRANNNDLTFHRVPYAERSETMQAPKVREHFADRETERETTQVAYTGHAAMGMGGLSAVPITVATTEAKATLRPWTEAMPQHGAPTNLTANANQITQQGWDPRDTLRAATAETPYLGATPTNLTANANQITQQGWDPRATLKAATQDTPYLGATPTNLTANANEITQQGWDPRATLRVATADTPYLGAAPSQNTSNANQITQAGWDARPTLRIATQDTPQHGAPNFTNSPGYQIQQATTDPKITLRMATQDNPNLGGPAGYERSPTDQTQWYNMLIDDRKEVGTFNRMAGPNHLLTPANYQINIQLKPDDCTDWTRTANLEVAQYSNMRAMPTIQVPNNKYTDQTACYYINPIQTDMLKGNPYVNDVRRGFT